MDEDIMYVADVIVNAGEPLKECYREVLEEPML